MITRRTALLGAAVAALVATAPALAAVGLRSCLYEAGFSLYHAGQCLRIVI